jgi:hypothetical protein
MNSTFCSAPSVRWTAASAFALLAAMIFGAPQAARAGGFVELTNNLDAPDGSVNGSVNPSFKKVVNGQLAVQVDNGFVIYQGFQNNPTLNFFNGATNVTTKLRSAGFGTEIGNFFTAGGIVFAPCTPAANNFCQTAAGAVPGIGIGFGELIIQGGGPGSSAGGWSNDTGAVAHVTDDGTSPGSISAVAINGANSYAVGWHNSPNVAIVEPLDPTTYAPTALNELPPPSGGTSQALGINLSGTLVVGMASNKAVYAAPTDSAWTVANLGTTALGHKILKSSATAANNNGIIAGTATVKENVAGRTNVSVTLGFVYDTTTHTPTFFEAPGANVVPLKVLANGDVVGNLAFVTPKGTASGTPVANHPFMFDGETLNDYGTMNGAYGCRVNRPNNLGELVGTCIPNSGVPYGVTGTAFYINTQAASPTFLDLNASIRAINGITDYNFGSATSIDDEEELTVVGIRFAANGSASRAAFLAESCSYMACP